MNHKNTYTLQLLTAIGLIAFWMAFFMIGFENPNYPSYYSKFEHMYTVGIADGILNAFINIWCVGFGVWQMYVVIK